MMVMWMTEFCYLLISFLIWQPFGQIGQSGGGNNQSGNGTSGNGTGSNSTGGNSGGNGTGGNGLGDNGTGGFIMHSSHSNWEIRFLDDLLEVMTPGETRTANLRISTPTDVPAGYYGFDLFAASKFGNFSGIHDIGNQHHCDTPTSHFLITI